MAILDRLAAAASSAGRSSIGLSYRRVLAAGMLLLCAVLLPTTGMLRGVDQALIEWRSAQVPRESGNRFAFIAIDKPSLDAVGVWPWPRRIHAQAVDRLVQAGVRDVFLDIDFSARSNADDDGLLEDALKRAGGGILLPAFLQAAVGADSSAALPLTKPIPAFEQNSWLAAANVMPDDDGVVRSLPFSVEAGQEPVQSASAVLAGLESPTGGSSYRVDFSISPKNIPIYSFADLLSGKIGAAQLAGRSVVVGASAIELKDYFNVPVLGIVSGPVLHLLGAETLLQQRIMQPADARMVTLGVTALLLVLFAGLFFCRNLPALLVLALSSLALEAIALFVQTRYAIELPTACSQFVIVCSAGLFLLDRLNLSQGLLSVANRRRRGAEHVLRQVIKDSVDAIVILNEAQIVIQHNAAAESILSRSFFAKLKSDVHSASPVLSAALANLRSGAAEDDRSVPVELEIGERAFEGTVTRSQIHGHGNSDAHVIFCLTLRDVTQRKAQERRLLSLSQFDELTQTLRRDELLSRSSGRVAIAALAVNLHRFAPVNAVFGREVGDHLLVEVARRLALLLPSGSPIGRTDGDGFAALILESADGSFDESHAEALVAQLSQIYEIGDTGIEIGFRLGFSTVSTQDGAQLVKEAETALDAARRTAGRSCLRYDASISAKEARTRELELDMRSGLAGGEFFLAFQPQVDLATGIIAGAEALVRWRHPRHGIVPPSDFIGIAEANGFVCELGRWVLQAACREAASWPAALTIAVNVAPLQFLKTDVPFIIMQALDESGLDAARLHIEVTESGFMHASEELLVQFAKIRALGVKIALDDFGTGFSSLQYVAQFPLDKLKIDQSFVRLLGTHPTANKIVNSMKSLAASLGATVVCEGIEHVEQWQALKEMGCEQGQGYLFGRPQTAREFLLAAQAGATMRRYSIVS